MHAMAYCGDDARRALQNSTPHRIHSLLLVITTDFPDISVPLLRYLIGWAEHEVAARGGGQPA
jgi:hypothetical protein